jgi:hypothetical protein
MFMTAPCGSPAPKVAPHARPLAKPAARVCAGAHAQGAYRMLAQTPPRTLRPRLAFTPAVDASLRAKRAQGPHSNTRD